MTAKEYLAQYRESLTRTQELTDHLNELRAECDNLRNHMGERVALDAAVTKYVDACDDAAVYLAMLAEKRKEIEAVIERVQDVRHHELLTERYINGRTLVQIAADRNQSYEHICRLHGAALCAVSELLP